MYALTHLPEFVLADLPAVARASLPIEFLSMSNLDAPSTIAQRPRVLVVEDEAAVQASLSVFLTQHGFSTLRASHVDDALSALSGVRVDAVTLDIRIPDESGLKRSGLSILEAMRLIPMYEQVPVVIFTGVELSPDDEEKARRLGAVILYKPQPYAAVLEYLNELSGKSESRLNTSTDR